MSVTVTARLETLRYEVEIYVDDTIQAAERRIGEVMDLEEGCYTVWGIEGNVGSLGLAQGDDIEVRVSEKQLALAILKEKKVTPSPSVLKKSISTGDTELATILIKAGIDKTFLTSGTGSEKYAKKSISSDQPEALEYLLSIGSPVSVSLLESAIILKRLECLKVLLQAGGRPNELAKKGYSPLHLACKSGARTNEISILISSGGDPSLPSRCRGYNCMHFAASEGTPNIIKLLHSYDSSLILSTTKAGLLTPLHVAAQSCNAAVVKSLLKLGASRLAQDSKGLTSLYYASSMLHSSCIPALTPSCVALQRLPGGRDAKDLLRLRCVRWRGRRKKPPLAIEKF